MDVIKYSKDPTFKFSKQKNIYIIWELVLSYFKMILNVRIYYYYILSSNKGIFVWPIWPEVNCPYFHTPGK
jgi:hypothetical protein